MNIIKRVVFPHVLNASLGCFDLWPSLPLAAAVSSPQPLPCAGAPSSSAPPSSALAPRRSARAAAAHGAPFHAACQTALHTRGWRRDITTFKFCNTTVGYFLKHVYFILLYSYCVFSISLNLWSSAFAVRLPMITPDQYCSAFMLQVNQSLDLYLNKYNLFLSVQLLSNPHHIHNLHNDHSFSL